MTAPNVGRDVDVEALVVAWLKPRRPAAHVGTRLPDDITGDVLQVMSSGGSSRWDNALLRVDVASFRPGGEGAARPLATDVHGDMRALDGQTVDLDDGPQLVNAVRVWTPPTPRFWTPRVDRVIATYELDLPVVL